MRESGATALLSRSVDTRPAERLRAAHANEQGADLVVGFSHPNTDVVGVHYFESSLSHSEAGLAVATALGEALGVSAVGRSTPLLRATRAPAVLVALPRLDSSLGKVVMRRLDRWFAEDRDDQSPSSPR